MRLKGLFSVVSRAMGFIGGNVEGRNVERVQTVGFGSCSFRG